MSLEKPSHYVSHHQTTAHCVYDGNGRTFHLRSHPIEFGQNILLLIKGNKTLEIDISDADGLLLRDLLNLAYPEKKGLEGE